jgi:D-galactarolactone cycloisomerase
MSEAIASIKAWRSVSQLAEPLDFGTFTIRERSYCNVEVSLIGGAIGRARSIDRGVAVELIVQDLVGPSYMGADAKDAIELWHRALRSATPALSAGAGLRALSLVDLAVHDAVRPFLDATATTGQLPSPEVWAIVGYPPSSTPEQVAAQTRHAIDAGVAGVKLPVAAHPEQTRARVKAALAEAGDSQVALDLAWSSLSADGAARLVDGLPLKWVEDPFVPGALGEIRKLRSLTDVPIAVGDEDCSLYHPLALIDEGIVDFVRLDSTCQGGESRMRELAPRLKESGVLVSWHMSALLHAKLAGRWGIPSRSIELSSPGAGVDPLLETVELADAIKQLSGHTTPV